MEFLVIIDMINGFCEKGFPLSLSENTEQIQAHINNRANEVINTGGKVFFICDNHTPNDPEIGKPYPVHCLANTFESEIVKNLIPISKRSIILHKKTLSIFMNTGFEEYLKMYLPKGIEIAGVCTEVCILFAAFELRIRGINVNIDSRGVLPLTPLNQKYFLEYCTQYLGVNVNLDLKHFYANS